MIKSITTSIVKTSLVVLKTGMLFFLIGQPLGLHATQAVTDLATESNADNHATRQQAEQPSAASQPETAGSMTATGEKNKSRNEAAPVVAVKPGSAPWPHRSEIAQFHREITPPPPPGPYMSTALTYQTLKAPSFDEVEPAQQNGSGQQAMGVFSPDRPWPSNLRPAKRWQPDEGYHYFGQPVDRQRPLAQQRSVPQMHQAPRLPVNMPMHASQAKMRTRPADRSANRSVNQSQNRPANRPANRQANWPVKQPPKQNRAVYPMKNSAGPGWMPTTGMSQSISPSPGKNLQRRPSSHASGMPPAAAIRDYQSRNGNNYHGQMRPPGYRPPGSPDHRPPYPMSTGQ